MKQSFITSICKKKDKIELGDFKWIRIYLYIFESFYIIFIVLYIIKNRFVSKEVIIIDISKVLQESCFILFYYYSFKIKCLEKFV